MNYVTTHVYHARYTKMTKYEKVFINSIYRSTNKTIAFIKKIYHSSDVGGV